MLYPYFLCIESLQLGLRSDLNNTTGFWPIIQRNQVQKNQRVDRTGEEKVPSVQKKCSGEEKLCGSLHNNIILKTVDRRLQTVAPSSIFCQHPDAGFIHFGGTTVVLQVCCITGNSIP